MKICSATQLCRIQERVTQYYNSDMKVLITSTVNFSSHTLYTVTKQISCEKSKKRLKSLHKNKANFYRNST